MAKRDIEEMLKKAAVITVVLVAAMYAVSAVAAYFNVGQWFVSINMGNVVPLGVTVLVSVLEVLAAQGYTNKKFI